MTGAIGPLGPVEGAVDCGGGSHRLRCDGGRLEARDHPDAEGERLLGALGGERPACLVLLDAWDAHRDDLRVLILGPRHAGDHPRADPAAVEAMRNGNLAGHIRSQRASRANVPPAFRGRMLPGPEDVDEQEEHLRRHVELLRLFTLPDVLQHRLCVTVAAAWCERDPGHPALEAALVGRARWALQEWAGPGTAVEVACGPVAELRQTPGRVSAVLPVTWLVDVWGRATEVVDGEFVVEAEPRLRTVARRH